MKHFNTTDIVLAATLKVLGYKISGIDIDGHLGTFKFNNIEDDTLNKFYMGELCVEPTAFNNAIKQLTTLVRQKHKK